MDVVVEIAIVDDGVMPWQWCDQSGAKLYARQGRLLDDVPHLITCCTSLMTVKYLFFFFYEENENDCERSSISHISYL
jgi:hypothetical protein